MLWPAKPEKKEPPTTAIGVNLYRYLNSPTKQSQKGHSNIIIVDQISFKSSIKAHPCKVWYMHGMVPHKVLSSVSCYWLLCKPQLQSRLPSSWTSTGSTKCLHWLFFKSTYRKKKFRGGKRDPGWQNSTQVCQQQNQEPVEINMRMEQTKLSLFTCGAG